jgi:hypothetical protein
MPCLVERGGEKCKWPGKFAHPVEKKNGEVTIKHCGGSLPIILGKEGRAMKRALCASGLLALALLLGGCEDTDNRSTEELLYAPAPDFATRNVMACPKCGAPQKPWRINGDKSFYRCTGQPPKFRSHPEVTWAHRLSHDKHSPEQ